MALQMRLDLPLCLGKETKAPSIAQSPGHCPNRERTQIPERIEQALPAGQLGNTPFGPVEVLRFLPCRLFQRLPRRRIPAGKRLSLVEPLRTHFADMIDPHQCRGVAPFRIAE